MECKHKFPEKVYHTVELEIDESSENPVYFVSVDGARIISMRLTRRSDEDELKINIIPNMSTEDGGYEFEAVHHTVHASYLGVTLVKELKDDHND